MTRAELEPLAGCDVEVLFRSLDGETRSAKGILALVDDKARITRKSEQGNTIVNIVPLANILSIKPLAIKES